MASLLIYILKWALSLALLYIPFTIMLRKESFATLNRLLLLGIPIVALSLPLLEITFPVEIMAPAEELATTFGNSIVSVPGNGDTSEAPVTKETFELLTWQNAGIIYIGGVAVSLFLAIASMSRMFFTIRNGELWKEQYKGITIHCRAGEVAPFSWFGHIVISEKDYNECGQGILLHEEGHIRHKHSWDMLLINCIKAAQWFNPFVYMLENDLKDIHEYEADRYAMKHHCDTRAYQLLILRKAVGETNFALANNFGQSSVRKRIAMMARKQSSQWRKCKYLYLLPALALATLIQAKPRYVYMTPANGFVETTATTEPHPATTEPEISVEIQQKPEAKEEKAKSRTAVVHKAQISDNAVMNSEPKAEPENTTEEKVQYIIEPYYEYIDISRSAATAELASSNVNRCSIKIRFVVSDNGKAQEITAGNCNISIKGNGNGNLQAVIEEINRAAATIAKEHIASKTWKPAEGNGSNTRTVYDAHLIFHHGENAVIASDNISRPLVVGLTPLE